MPLLDLDAVLRFRIAAENARMEDLARFLDHTTTGLTGLTDRVEAQSLTTRSGTDWSTWHASARDADPLVREVLALGMNRLLQDAKLDSGVFEVADFLLSRLTSTAGLPGVVLGHTQELESIDEDRSTISLRFPGTRVWDLPFLAHEFGHHAAARLPHLDPALRDSRPLQDVVDSVAGTIGGDLDKARSHANELVADAVATTCLGPTYPIATLCLRTSDGGRASATTSTHPSWRDRVATMGAVLEALTAATGLHRYRDAHLTTVRAVENSLFRTLCPPAPAAAEAAERTVVSIVRHRPGLVYRDADAAIDVAHRLAQLDPEPPADASVLAVLDGVWRWRLAHIGEDESAVADLALSYCRSIATGGAR
ncbi:hypothetical protein ACFFQW_22105 [Umezawaea endophytica]|uniref:Uncharacterized protein n=1 Tax=Umezawaea endophytica TaxID=1654476 RepID=A0A9X2VIU9_9PSEU|nr:hypothetical protein [Umezawaea endophytica]MCS7477441.1 hypothetical protein [Umezawaea endophytica]